MTFLADHLPFNSTSVSKSELPPRSRLNDAALPPLGSHLVISDTLQSPGTFTLYHLVHAAIARKQPVVWVDLRAEGKKSVEAVLRRMGTVLPKSSDMFFHVQPAAYGSMAWTAAAPPLVDGKDELNLKSLHFCLQDTLKSAKEPLVILHGLSDLLNVGFSVQDVHRFVRAMLALVHQVVGILVSTLHADNLIDGQTADHDLLERLLRSANGWWRVEELASGRSGDIHGEISSHPLLGTEGCTVVPKSHPLQYRLETNTVKLFPKGTGRGYL